MSEQLLREALQRLLSTGGVIAEATDAELQAAIDDPHAEEIVQAQAAAVLNARAALAQPAEGGEVAKLYCETCTGTGKVFQEVQHGCWVGGEFECPDCDGNGYINSKVWCTTPPASQEQEPFGHFRAEPFGWTDCAPTDEGAIPLYEHPTGRPRPLDPNALSHAINVMPWRDEVLTPDRLREFGAQLWLQFCAVPVAKKQGVGFTG